MDYRILTFQEEAIKIEVMDSRGVVGHAYLYLIRNDRKNRPYGYIEDLYIVESFRGKGHGTALIEMVIAEAKKKNCYKLITTSRNGRTRVHKLYQTLGFCRRGSEFRMDL